MSTRLLLAAVAACAMLGATPAGGAGPLVLNEPTGIAVEPGGALLVVESGLHRLVRVEPSRKVVPLATFVKPWGIARAPDGTVYVGDDASLLRVAPDGTKTPVAEAPAEIGPIAVAASGDVFYTTASALYRGSTRIAGSLHGPHGLAVRADGTLLVSDTNDNRILTVDPATGAAQTFATLGHPRGIGVATDGTVYAVAADERRVVRFDASGRRLGLVGPAFVDPYALAVGSDDTVYGLDIGAGVVRRIGDAWGAAPRLPTPRAAHAVVVVAGAIYVLGGPGSSRVDRFNGRRWTLATHLPDGIVNAPVAAALGHTIYVIGGFVGASNVPTARVSLFDTTTRKWRRGPSLPAACGGAASVVLDGRIHVIGGGNDVSTLKTHWVFDPKTGSWSAAAPLPRAEGSPAAVALGGKLYAIGGRSGLSDFGDTYVYDPAKDEWTDGPRIPPRGTAGAAAWKGSIYLFGGESQASAAVLGDVFRLSPRASAWQRIGRMPRARNYARSVVYRGRIYVVGGSTTAGDSHGATGSRLVEWFAPRPS